MHSGRKLQFSNQHQCLIVLGTLDRTESSLGWIKTMAQCGTGGMSAPKKFEPIPVKAEDAPNIYRTCSVKKFLKKKFAFFRQTQKCIQKLAPSRPPILDGFCCFSASDALNSCTNG